MSSVGAAPGQITGEFYMDMEGFVNMLVTVPGVGEYVGRTAVKAVGDDARRNPSGNPKIFKESLRKQGVR